MVVVLKTTEGNTSQGSNPWPSFPERDVFLSYLNMTNQPVDVELDELTHATLVAYASEKGLTPEEAANQILAEYIKEQGLDNQTLLTE